MTAVWARVRPRVRSCGVVGNDPQNGSGAVCALCGPFVGSTQFRAWQRRPDGGMPTF